MLPLKMVAGSGVADPVPYFAASAVSSLVSFPLWKASTISQCGYALTAKTAFGKFLEAARPPWRGSFVVVSGMTWSRAIIFFGSDEGARWLQKQGWSAATATTLPPLFISVNVQIANQPFVRSTVMLQGDPKVRNLASSAWPNYEVLKHLWRTKGPSALWLGTGVGIARTVPKYVTAIVAKDVMESVLEPADDSSSCSLVRSAKKSVVAGVVGAVLTNPLDVVQNEMFRSDENAWKTIKRLNKAEGGRWLLRGCEKNVLASAIPIAVTIFLTDTFASWRA